MSNRISESLSEIKEKVRAVISYSQGIENPQVDKLIDDWCKAKDEYIKLFDGPIYEWPASVTVKLDENIKKDLFTNFYSEVINILPYNKDLNEFLLANRESFWENKVYDISNCPRGAKVGMKLIKAFKFFFDDKKVLRKVQDMASELIQKNTLTGKLCFSVHPLDFLSSSENTYNWRSCHALDGDYRSGNLSYMVDNSTFMVYIKGEESAQLPHFGDVLWNSKKWRMLLNENPTHTVLFAGRQYPFSSDELLNLVGDIYNNILYSCRGYNYSWSWYNKYIEKGPNGETLDERYMPIKTPTSWYLVSINDVVEAHPDALNYNDLLASTCYTHPWYKTRSLYDKYQSPKMTVGGTVLCPCCGTRVLTAIDHMMCMDCELKYDYDNDEIVTCDFCGQRYWRDEGAITEDGHYLCPECLNEYYINCDRCGSLVHKNDVIVIGNGCYCKDCYDTIMEEIKDGK